MNNYTSLKSIPTPDVLAALAMIMQDQGLKNLHNRVFLVPVEKLSKTEAFDKEAHWTTVLRGFNPHIGLNTQQVSKDAKEHWKQCSECCTIVTHSTVESPDVNPANITVSA